MDVLREFQHEIDISSGIIRAAEPWSKEYQKDPTSFLGLTTTEARLERKLKRYLRQTSENAAAFINWGELMRVQAYQVEVLVNDDEISKQSGLIAEVVFEDISIAAAYGAQAGEAIYRVPLGISSTDAAIQKLTTEEVAWLVGKKVDKTTGLIIDNPNAKYAVTDSMRNDIAAAIKKAINLRLDQYQTVELVGKAIANPDRAVRIAQTETVNAYQGGMLEFADQSGAVGKESLTLNYSDICGTNANAGIIGLRENFPSGHSRPAYHTGCRCSLRVVYPGEISNR